MAGRHVEVGLRITPAARRALREQCPARRAPGPGAEPLCCRPADSTESVGVGLAGCPMAWDADTRDAAQPQLILDVQRAPVEGFSVPAGPGLVFVVRAVTVAHPITRAS